MISSEGKSRVLRLYSIGLHHQADLRNDTTPYRRQVISQTNADFCFSDVRIYLLVNILQNSYIVNVHEEFEYNLKIPADGKEFDQSSHVLCGELSS